MTKLTMWRCAVGWVVADVSKDRFAWNFEALRSTKNAKSWLTLALLMAVESLKTGATGSLETSTTAHPTTQRHIPHIWNPHLHRSDNLKTRTIKLASFTTMMRYKHLYRHRRMNIAIKTVSWIHTIGSGQHWKSTVSTATLLRSHSMDPLHNDLREWTQPPRRLHLIPVMCYIHFHLTNTSYTKSTTTLCKNVPYEVWYCSAASAVVLNSVFSVLRAIPSAKKNFNNTVLILLYVDSGGRLVNLKLMAATLFSFFLCYIVRPWWWRATRRNMLDSAQWKFPVLNLEF
jgi:hypothetical protein